MKHIDYKAEGGKLLRIDLELDENIIKEINIRGDFFVHPEEGIRAIEEAITSSKIEEVEKKAGEVVRSDKLEVVGFSPEDLEAAIRDCIK